VHALESARFFLQTNSVAETQVIPCSRAKQVPAVPARTASAQATTEYYVVQDSATKKCTIVDKKPTTTTMVQVGPMAFKTRTEAEAGMKTITVCSSN
jgi:hypothetical protein